MGFDAYAALYVGARLSAGDALALFGATTEQRVNTKCPEDGRSNRQKYNFCAQCGNDLRYEVTTNPGVESISDLEGCEALRTAGLDAWVPSDSHGSSDVIVGKRLAGSRSIADTVEMIEVDGPIGDVIDQVKKSLQRVGIDDAVKLYFVTDASD